MKGLVISGGGAKGAWGGGVAQALYEIKDRRWDKYVGCSTGSLLITTIPAEDFKVLKEMYTSVDMAGIFSVNPYTKKGKFNIWNAIWRLIRKKTSLGESGNLKKLLKTTFNKSNFDALKTNNKDVWVTVTNLTKGQPEHFSNKELTYDEFINMVMASTSVPIAMDLVKFRGSEYLDGGVMEHIPILKAIDEGCDDIDIIVHRPETFPNDDWHASNMFDVVTRSIDLLQREVSFADAVIAQLAAEVKQDTTLNFYYTPTELCRNSLVFDKAQMLKWWDEGYEFVKDNKVSKVTVKIKTKKTGKPTIKKTFTN